MNLYYLLSTLSIYTFLVLTNAWSYKKLAKVRGWDAALSVETNQRVINSIRKRGLVKTVIFWLIANGLLMICISFVPIIGDYFLAFIAGADVTILQNDIRVIRMELKSLHDRPETYIR